MATDAKVTLGDFDFHSYELPEFINFGGPFNAIVHQQPGGTRQIDSLGPNDAPIRWEGLMLSGIASPLGPAADRANQLWEMFQAGDKLPFHAVSSGDASLVGPFDVIISDLQLRAKAVNYYEYSIELTRVIDAIEAVPETPNLAPDLNNAQNVILPVPAPNALPGAAF